MRKKYLLTCLLIFVFVTLFAQRTIKGKVVDASTKEPISFVSVVLKNTNQGTVSDQDGEFSLSYNERHSKDTLGFQVIGFVTQNIAIADIQTHNLTISLKQNINQLNSVVLTGKKLDAKAIVEKVLENESSNYVYPTSKKQVFFSTLFNSDIQELNLEYKKGTIPWLSKEKIEELEKNTPKHSENHIGFLGDFYTTTESVNKSLKIAPFRAMLYETVKIEEMDIFKSFGKMFSDTDKKEYWKIKSGILGTKIEINDSLSTNDTLKKYKILRNAFYSGFRYRKFKRKKEWEFLHKTNRYEYEIVGTTTLNDESVYIIDFKPKKKGDFVGRMYISVETYALVKANYKQVEDKAVNRIKMLGFLTERKDYKASIYFERKENKYQLKFFSFFVDDVYGVDRKVALQKKKDRFLFDKKLEELKVDLKVKTSEKISFDYLVLDSEEITLSEFDDFEEKKTIEFTKEKQEGSVYKDLLPLSAIQEFEMYKYGK